LIPGEGQKVFDAHIAYDVVDAIFVHRHAVVRVLEQNAAHFVRRRVTRYQYDFLSRHHHVGRGQFRKFQGARGNFAGVRVYGAGFHGFTDELLQLAWGMPGFREGGRVSERSEQQVRAPGQKPNQRPS
jgi:hypothetical protein